MFYLPTMAMDPKDSTYYIRRAEVKNDSIFGFQVITEWDMYQLLGIHNRPAGTEWGLGLDWFEKRGFGHATDFRYHTDGILGIRQGGRPDRLLRDPRQRDRQPRAVLAAASPWNSPTATGCWPSTARRSKATSSSPPR